MDDGAIVGPQLPVRVMVIKPSHSVEESIRSGSYSRQQPVFVVPQHFPPSEKASESNTYRPPAGGSVKVFRSPHAGDYVLERWESTCVKAAASTRCVFFVGSICGRRHEVCLAAK